MFRAGTFRFRVAARIFEPKLLGLIDQHCPAHRALPKQCSLAERPNGNEATVSALKTERCFDDAILVAASAHVLEKCLAIFFDDIHDTRPSFEKSANGPQQRAPVRIDLIDHAVGIKSDVRDRSKVEEL
jgi:hypothetical protein